MTMLYPWLVSRGPIVPRDQLWHYGSGRASERAREYRERKEKRERERERQSNGAAEKAEMGNERRKKEGDRGRQ